MNILKDKKFLWFIAKFLLIFCGLYFGTLAVIGLAAPGKLYSPFIEKYLDYVGWLKQSMIWSVHHISSWLGYETYQEPDYVIRIVKGKAVKIAMDCVGYGVYSFWMAYIIANDGRWVKKLAWVAGGLLLLWMINSARISMVLVYMQQKKPMPLGIDHHTWFNIVAYIVIFGMIAAFERRKDN
ncbi:MAG: exosortase/archaeosortase family protein [Chitinophagaceae bacterium]|nr:MAG: exosortase/archaeosortase family protein [Chitinophagaceae bacterium]